MKKKKDATSLYEVNGYNYSKIIIKIHIMIYLLIKEEERKGQTAE
jgi:hypothetical protein